MSNPFRNDLPGGWRLLHTIMEVGGEQAVIELDAMRHATSDLLLGYERRSTNGRRVGIEDGLGGNQTPFPSVAAHDRSRFRPEAVSGTLSQERAFVDYNTVKPKQRLGWRTPEEYYEAVKANAN